MCMIEELIWYDRVLKFATLKLARNKKIRVLYN